MALQIEPCPFCGGHHLHMVAHALTYSVACQSCRCRGPQKKNQELAVMQWNDTSRQHRANAQKMTALFTANDETSNQQLANRLDMLNAKPVG